MKAARSLRKVGDGVYTKRLLANAPCLSWRPVRRTQTLRRRVAHCCATAAAGVRNLSSEHPTWGRIRVNPVSTSRRSLPELTPKHSIEDQRPWWDELEHEANLAAGPPLPGSHNVAVFSQCVFVPLLPGNQHSKEQFTCNLSNRRRPVDRRSPCGRHVPWGRPSPSCRQPPQHMGSPWNHTINNHHPGESHCTGIIDYRHANPYCFFIMHHHHRPSPICVSCSATTGLMYVNFSKNSLHSTSPPTRETTLKGVRHERVEWTTMLDSRRPSSAWTIVMHSRHHQHWHS